MDRICAKLAIELPTAGQIEEVAPVVCQVERMHELVTQAHMASCGLGVMCRDGIYQLYNILNDIIGESGQNNDLELLSDLCEVIVLCNECALSVSIAELMLVSLKAHREEWALHIERKLCSQLRCMYTLYIAPDKCNGCGACREACPKNAILGGEDQIHIIRKGLCTRCGACEAVCPQVCVCRAGQFTPRCPESPIPVGTFTQGLGIRKRRGRSGD